MASVIRMSLSGVRRKCILRDDIIAGDAHSGRERLGWPVAAMGCNSLQARCVIWLPGGH